MSLTDNLTVHDATLARLAASYQELPAPFRKCPEPVLRHALLLAGGNPRRMTTDGDGTVIVWNGPVW